MQKETIMFPCENLTLEGVLCIPEEKGLFPAVVVCHPHPQYGGNMSNNMVEAVCKSLGDHSIISLRFNFRGVGRSDGGFADGVGEQEDVKAALSFLEKQEKVDSTGLGLCGYSFGTMVGIPVADEDERVQAFAGISSFFTAPGLLQNFIKPKFFIHGTDDDFISPGQMEDTINNLPDPKICETIEGADHFWWGFDKLAGTKVGDFFASCLK